MTIQEAADFDDCDNDSSVNFSPTWQLPKTTEATSTMTEEIIYETSQVQSIQTTSIHVYH
jgi:hypothetical protein